MQDSAARTILPCSTKTLRAVVERGSILPNRRKGYRLRVIAMLGGVAAALVALPMLASGASAQTAGDTPAPAQGVVVAQPTEGAAPAISPDTASSADVSAGAPTVSAVPAPAVPAGQKPTVQGPARGAPSAAAKPPVVVVRPAGPVQVQGPRAGARGPYRPAARRPVARPQARVANAPRLPSTGTGGLLNSDTGSGLGVWTPGMILLAAGALAAGAFIYRRQRSESQI
jgi:hypothetical protein